MRKCTKVFMNAVAGSKSLMLGYTVEVTKRFNGLDLIACLKNCGWRFVTLYRRQ